MVDRPYLDHAPTGPAAPARARYGTGRYHSFELPAGAAIFAAEAVIAAVCAAFDVSETDLKKFDRRRSVAHVSEARKAAFYLLRRHTRMSTPAIIRAMGGRDHSAVVRGYEAALLRREMDAWFRETTDRLERELEEKAKAA